MPKSLKLFSPNPEQLISGVEHVCYEYANLMSAAHWSMKGEPPWRTHADDAFLLGCRKIGDFLPNEHRSTRGKAQHSDILARDYLPKEVMPDWSLPVWTSWRDKMHKQLVHLSYVRDKSWVHHESVPKLEEEFREAMQKFVCAVAPEYKNRFPDELTKCSGKPGFAAIKL